jgi:hypothetical protein
MQSTQKLFQVFVESEQEVRPSRWFPRESMAQRYCEAFNHNAGPNRALARYQIVEVPIAGNRRANQPR